MHEKYQHIKWFVYARKSEDDKDKQVQSIEGQTQELNALQERAGGLRIVDTICEEQSAKAPGRPKFNAMIARIKKGEANGILVWAYNRLLRNPVDDGTIKWLLQQGTIQCIKTIDRDFLPSDNALLLSIEGGTANQFILDLKKNVHRGMQQKLAKGWKPSQAPAGYLNTRTENSGENYIIKDPVRFVLIRKAWDMILTGKYTPDKIADILNDECGYRTPKTKRRGGKTLARSTMHRIFNDPFYTGLFIYNGQTYNGKHEPMITMEEFEHAQKLLHKPGRTRSKRHWFPYTGMMKCGDCGCAITATAKVKRLQCSGEFKTYVFYHCTKRKKTDKPCDQHEFVTAPQLEQLISAELEKCAISKKVRDWAIKIIDAEKENEGIVKEKILQSQQQGLECTKRELSNLTSLRLRDLIDDDEFTTRKQDLQSKVAIVTQKINESHSTVHTWRKKATEAFEFAHAATAKFSNGKEEERKAIFASLGSNYTLKDKKLFITKHKSLEAIAKSRDVVEYEIERFELENSIDIQGQNASLYALCPNLGALVDEVGTEIHKSDQSKELQA